MVNCNLDKYIYLQEVPRMKNEDYYPLDTRGYKIINRKPRVNLTLGLSPAQHQEIKQYCAMHQYDNVSGKLVSIIMDYISQEKLK